MDLGLEKAKDLLPWQPWPEQEPRFEDNYQHNYTQAQLSLPSQFFQCMITQVVYHQKHKSQKVYCPSHRVPKENLLQS